jgi:hypothetical protein
VASYEVHRDFSNPNDLSFLVFSAFAHAISDGPGIVAIANVDVRDYAFTLGPVRPGFAEITIGRTSNGIHLLEVALDNLSCNEPGLDCVVQETVPILLGTPMTVTFRIQAAIEFNPEAPSAIADGRALIQIEGVRDASGNPVPIYAATALPEPAGLASIGLALIGGAYIIRRRTKG